MFNFCYALDFIRYKMNDQTLSQLQHIGDILSSKLKRTFQGTFRASNPVYRLPEPFILPKNRSYESGLLYFATDNYIINVDKHSQKFYYSVDKGTKFKIITLPIGVYKYKTIINEIKKQIHANGDNSDKIIFDSEENRGKTVIEITDENYQIDFTQGNTIRNLLGFSSIIISKGRHESTNSAQITSTRAINIHCSIIHGGYDWEGRDSDIIYSFPAYKVGIARKINEEPTTIRYLPVSVDVIKEIRFRITNNIGEDIDFMDEPCAFGLSLIQV